MSRHVRTAFWLLSLWSVESLTANGQEERSQQASLLTVLSSFASLENFGFTGKERVQEICNLYVQLGC